MVKKLSSNSRIGVLYGGTTSEREVSLNSGQAVFSALKDAGLNVVAIDIQDEPIEQIIEAKIDVAFIALHGGFGEDGRLQALLQLMDIPYTGSDSQASALAMDKLICKQIWNGIGLPTSPFTALDDTTDFGEVLQSLGGVMVKPAHEGSSVGMAIAKTKEALEEAYKNAVQYDATVFAEKLLPGGEYTVSILNGRALPPIKLETDNVFYDYEAKYLADDTRYLCPCGLSLEKENELKSLALRAFNSLHCKSWGRVDLMMDEDNEFRLLEVNTVPGMTDHSLVPMAAKAAGLSFQGLVLEILQTTVELD